jgi:GrpB-like predicted nucleotidyltransferase (UPF0157 family)/N-acetylglutamate synthase-like GNAT family acetyltransferase
VTSIDEPVELVEPRRDWPALAAAENEVVRAALGPLAVAVEHIGSTAVPGLAAKPIIDLQVGTAGRPGPAAGSPLAVLGYEGLGEAGVPGRLYFRKRGPAAYNVHIVAYGGNHWVANLAVRDYLRAHPAAAAEYVAVKRAAAGAGRLLAYSERKGEFVRELVRRALAWTAGTERAAAGDRRGVVRLSLEWPNSDVARALVEQLWQEECRIYGSTGPCPRSPGDLEGDRSRFVVARLHGIAVGCGAIREHDPTTAEIKRVFVVPAQRRRGVARSILTELERRAAGLGFTSVVLETGTGQPGALRLYESSGYTRIPAYSPHADDPLSGCFRKKLDAAFRSG